MFNLNLIELNVLQDSILVWKTTFSLKLLHCLGRALAQSVSQKTAVILGEVMRLAFSLSYPPVL